MLNDFLSTIKQGIGWCLRHPTQLVVMYLSAFSMAYARKSGAMQCHALSPLGTQDFDQLTAYDPSRFQVSELFLEELDQSYTVFGNCPLEEAEYILFAEDHLNRTQIRKQKSVIPRLMGNSDYLLQEGHPKLEPSDCLSTYLTNKNTNRKVRLTTQGTCLGWDTYKTDERPANLQLQELANQYYSKLGTVFLANADTIVAVMALLNKHGQEHWSLLNDEEIQQYYRNSDMAKIIAKQFGRKMFALLIQYNNAIQKDQGIQTSYRQLLGDTFDDLLSKFTAITDRHVADTAATKLKRNHSLLSTLQILACNLEPLGEPCARKVVIAGTKHILDKSYIDEEDEIAFDWDDDSVVAPLRHYLETRQYVILNPR